MNLNNAEWKAARLNALDGIVITDRIYNLVIGLVVLWGLIVNYAMAHYLTEPIMNLSPGLILLLYFAGSIGGMLIVYKSPSAILSFLGFTLLAAGMGLILTFILQAYDLGSVLLAVRITGLVTLAMTGLAIAFPQFFLGLGRTLAVALGVCIVIELVFRLLLGFEMQWADWLVSLIFCGYIGYDWSRAQVYPKTLDNAVDSAADIYVDIVNLFILILRIVGRGSSSRKK